VPWKVGIRIGAPLQPESLFRHDGTDDELRVALARVEREVQALVDPVTARS
jgi:hypothetical protein